MSSMPFHRPRSTVGRALIAAAVLAAALTGCTRAAAPAATPLPPAADAQVEATAEQVEAVNTRVVRVENGLLELTATGEVLWDHKLALAERMERYGVPGLGLAVINDYRVEWARGYGVLEVDGEQAVTPGTLFHAGSIAKAVSAAAVLTLVQSGQLDLDRDVNEKLVSWQVPASVYTEKEKVTLRRLLSHSAGLTDGFTETGIECCYATEGEAPTVTIRQMLEADPVTGLPRPARVTATPGGEYRYANLGYGIVQLLVDETTRVPFARFMQETVLDPLGMASSTFEQPLPEALRARASTEHDGDGRPFVGKRHHFPILASGGLWTTPSDLARFALEIMRAYLGQSEALLSQQVAREMLTAQVPIRNGGLATASGLGFDLGGMGGQQSIQHGGATWGSTSYLIAFPEAGQGAVLMTNSPGGSALLVEILLSLSVEYGWPLLEDAPTPSTAVRELQVQSADVGLHVRLAGNPDSGCVLVAINGGPGLTSNYMWDLERLAGPDCAVLTYDQRGLGKSTQPADPDSATSYTLDKYAGDVEAIRRAIGAERLHLLGHSWGGIVAMEYAILYPQRVASLIFFGGGPPTWEDIEIAQRSFGRRVEQLMRSGVIPLQSEWADDGSDPMLPANFSDPAFIFPQDSLGGPPQFSQAVSDLTYSNLVGMDLRADLALLDKPVLLLFGRDDPFGLPMAEATRAALTGAQVDFVIIERCGHFWHECPDEFYLRVGQFLAGAVR